MDFDIAQVGDFVAQAAATATAWGEQPTEAMSAEIATGRGRGSSQALGQAVGNYAEAPEGVTPATTPYYGDVGYYELDDALNTYDESMSYGKFKIRDRENCEIQTKQQELETSLGRPLTEDEAAGFRIRSMSDKGSGPEDAFNDETPLDFSSPESRLEFVSRFTQQTGNDPRDGMLCGPASMLSAMIIAKGEQGVADIVNVLEKSNPEMAEKFTELKDRMANGVPLTPNDMVMLKSSLGDHFAKDLPEEIRAQGGVDPNGMDAFINDNPAIKEAFMKHHMEIAGVDRMGGQSGYSNGAPEHATLIIRDDDGNPRMVYDPNPRKSSIMDREGCGSQIIQDKQGLADYERIQHLDDKGLTRIAAREEGEEKPDYPKPVAPTYTYP